MPALVGLVLLLVETFAHPERSGRPVYQMMKAGVALLGMIAASPHAAPSQSSIDVDGIRLTESISSYDHATRVQGELWQDASVEGVPHNKRESVDFTRLPARSEGTEGTAP